MLFNTWTFLFFLVVTFAAYHFLPWPVRHKVWWQISLLTVASYVFYAWHTPWLVIILAASTWINAYVTLRLVSSTSTAWERKKWVTLAIVLNLTVLVFFKYASLVVGTFFPQSWWSQWGFDLTRIPLPIGISFFTFQGISLVIDVYRKPEIVQPFAPATLGLPIRESQGTPLFFKVAFFKAFFPQLVAGPIVKAREFIHQIGPKSLADVDWDDAARKLILGFFLKMVVADNLREATAWLHYPQFVGSAGVTLLFMLYAFSFQIFADFAGYSLIAMGLARIFGYQLPVNFNFPYISRSITEFWRRWHISLSTWLREYLYIPMGGNRKGPIRTYANLIIVMLLGGLWHGAAWSFMVWGGAHGLLLALERLLGVKVTDDGESQERIGFFGYLFTCLRIFLIFNLVSLLWLLFQLPDFKDVILYMKELVAWGNSSKSPQIYYAVTVFGCPVIAYHIWGMIRQSHWKQFSENYPVMSFRLHNLAYALLLFLIVTNSGNPGAFIYFQF